MNRQAVFLTIQIPASTHLVKSLLSLSDGDFV